MKLFALILPLLIFTHLSSAADVDRNTMKASAVLVTGASSGLGKKIAETLAAKGVYVYAGARKKEDITALSSQKNMQGVRLDVTKPDEIAAAVSLIQREGRGLYGVVNNAGVFLHAPLIEVSEKDMQFITDVNVFGPYRVTKAFAPLVIESKGRITTIGSIAGLNSGSMFGPYSMTKFAMEAYTDALAGEMKKFDVQVSIVEPGNFKSNIMQNMHKRRARMAADGATTMFEDEYKRLEAFAKADRSMHKEPNAVADAVVHALFSDTPKQRYMVVPNQREADMAVTGLLRKVAQLDKGHEFSKGNDALKTVLDAVSE